ncbi:MAG: DEAD/DEAH box helicase [Acidobacteriota bacterium]
MKTLAARCRRSVSSAVRSRGESYARQGRVRVVRAPEAESFLQAAVRGSASERYQVRIDWRLAIADLSLDVDCNCAYAEADVCKHIWATLVEMDRLGFSLRVPGAQELYLELGDAESGVDLGPALALLGDRSLGELPPSPWRQKIAGLTAGRSGVSGGLGASLPSASSIRTSALPPFVWLLPQGSSTLSERGELKVEFIQQPTLKTGQRGKRRAFILRIGYPNEAPVAVRSAIELLATLPESNWRSLGRYYGSTVSSATVPSALMPVVVPMLCATGHFGWWDEGAEPVPLTWDDGPPWRFALALEDHERMLRLTGRLVREGEEIPLTAPRLLLASGVVFLADRVARFAVETEALPWVNLLRRDEMVEIPERDVGAALETLWGDPRLPPLSVPERLRPRVENLPLTPWMEVYFPREGNRVGGQFGFMYGDQRTTVEDPRTILPGSAPGERLARDFEGEARRRDQLVAAGWLVSGQMAWITTADFFNAQKAHEEQGWQIEIEGRPLRSAGRFDLKVASGIDWFDLDGALDFGGVSARLPELLRTVREGRIDIDLPDGSVGLLPPEWLARYGSMARLAAGSGEGEALRFGAHQALVLDALLAAEPAVEVDAIFARARERLRSFDRLVPAEAPEGFFGSLRPYQQIGLAWLALLADLGLGGCLADDMGLGKTIQLLAHLAARKAQGLPAGRPSLLVVPKSVVPHWADEAARFTPGLRLGIFHGADRHVLAGNLGSYDVLVTTYATLRLDLPRLREMEFDLVVLDEAQAIKNSASQTAKACRLIRSRLRLALTGTPIENHLGELWSLFEFLNPGLLGALPVLSDHAGRSWLPPAALATVARALSPLLLRRTKDQVLTELPPKTEQTLFCELSAKERKRYDQLRDHYRQVLLGKAAPSLNGAKIIVLEALLRLRQAACHAALIDPGMLKEPSAKLDALLEQIAEIEAGGHKAIVFSQFTKFLAIVRDRLDRSGVVYEYLDGKTVDRRAKVDRFQNDPTCSLFLISLKAGGVGLNLTAASYVFLLDPWWNPAVETQAIDRAHRIGQTRAVFAYRLIARDTVEEKIIELQKEKRALADAIVSQDTRLLKQLTAEDLERLLS